MSDKTDSVSDTNNKAKDEFAGKPPAGAKRPEDAENATEADEAANAEFNDDDPKNNFANRVGGLRGGSD